MAIIKKPKLLIVGYPNYANKAYWSKLQSIAEFHIIDQKNYEESIPQFAEAVKSHGPFIACIYFIEWGKPYPLPMNERLLSPLVESGCKFFCAAGSGYERVDVDYLTRKGAVYANNPNAVGGRTADSTLMMIMMALRGISQQERSLRSGNWADREIVSRDAKVLTFGIIGMGTIGLQVAKHAQYLGFKRIQYNKRSRLSPEEEEGGAYHYVGFDELLATSDVLCLMTPLTKETRHMIGAKEFAKIKDGAILINTSRGAVIDEAAMVDALNSRKLLRVALDVYENEPEIHQGLLDSPHATLLPHCAVFSETISADAQNEILENLEQFLKTGKPNTPVNA